MNHRFAGKPRPDWKATWERERDRINLADVAIGLLGEPAGRAGERGRRLWWSCPLHADRNPSFCIDPVKPSWKCYGCGARGDAVTLVMKLEGVKFSEAVSRLTGGERFDTSMSHRSAPPIRREPKPPTRPSGLPHAEALSLVAESSARLWSPEGSGALAYLTGPRCLAPETIRSARLGWSPRVEIPKVSGGTFTARGVVIPWFDGDRLAMVKIRQAEGKRPKYAEAFRDRPALYPGRQAIRPGLPLVIPEGEFDALVLGQELEGMASIVTLGSASGRPEPAIIGIMLAAPRWFIALDQDEAGDKSAAGWPARSQRARPPKPFKDWTEAMQGGINLARWWADHVGLVRYTWDKLAAMRWGTDPDPGLIIDRPDPARRLAALNLDIDDPEEREAIRSDTTSIPDRSGEQQESVG